ncbi:hypothetical protein, partial [Rhodopseudomonas palustris]|uniref:hypothetical protein n=1 Tax=Rhodopseudomonas palustris TaxID=1076 RepID=UPI001AEC1981
RRVKGLAPVPGSTGLRPKIAAVARRKAMRGRAVAVAWRSADREPTTPAPVGAPPPLIGFERREFALLGRDGVARLRWLFEN